MDDVRDRTNVVQVIKGYVELKRAGTRIWNSVSRRAVRSTGEIAISDSQVGGARTRDHEDKARGLMRRDLALIKTKQGLTGALERPWE